MNRQIATFVVGETYLGLDILIIKEVYRHMTLTRVPGITNHIAGLMNLRGKVVTVIDLNVCFNYPPNDKIEDNHILILKTSSEILHIQQDGKLEGVNLGEDIVGLLINRMDDVLNIEDKDVLPTPPNLNLVEEELIQGVVKLGDRLVILLDITAVLRRVLLITETIDTSQSNR